MTSMEPAAVLGEAEPASDHSDFILPERVRKHLGALLAGIYTEKSVGFDATASFADLLAKLDAALGRARDRDDAEFRQLFLAATPALRRFALSLAREPAAADDLVQDAFLKAWKSRAKFELGTNFEAWIFTILRNHFYTAQRKHREVQDEEGGHAARLTSAPDQEGHLDLVDVRNAFARLAPMMREALTLVAIEGLSYEEAASIMGCEIGTAKSRVWRARNHLGQLLGFTGEEVGNDPVMLSALVGTGRTGM